MSRALLIRHAHAGDRHRWSGEDAQRPLTDKGWLQARGLVELLGEFAIDAVFSSPSTRCVETVTPLALSRGQDVVGAVQLAEGADPDVASRWLAAAGDVACCSHGDVIQGVLAALQRTGAAPDDIETRKAGTWILEVAAGQVSAARYLSPPTT